MSTATAESRPYHHGDLKNALVQATLEMIEENGIASVSVREAAKRGHQVVSYSRSIPDKQTPGVEYRAGDVQDPAFLASAFEHTDVVISALSTHGGLAGKGRLRALLSTAAGLAAERGVRFGVMGGAGSLLIAPDGPRLVDTPGFPEVAKPESLELAGALDDVFVLEAGGGGDDGHVRSFQGARSEKKGAASLPRSPARDSAPWVNPRPGRGIRSTSVGARRRLPCRHPDRGG